MSTQPSGAQSAHALLSADDPREIGGYPLHARLGAGGMGIVYLAHTPGGRPIALKAVRDAFAADPEFRRRFADEVASARSIHGLFTAQVVDSGADAPTPWLATAYVPGPSLQQVVERHGPLPVRTALLLVAGIAEALQAIHGAGVVHRDLKPANVLLAGDGPRVIDFGIARAADATGMTGTELRIGTAAYMAPEQAVGRTVTPATDVFALGALAAYVAGGVLPFGGGPESAVLYRVAHEEVDLSRVPAELYDLVRRCLDGRPPGPEHVHVHAQPTLTDFAAAPLAQAAPGGGGGREGPAPHRARRRRGRRVVAALVAAFLLSAGGTAYYVLEYRKGTERASADSAYSADPGGSADRSPTPSSGPPTPSPRPSSSAPDPVYVPDYADAELTSPDPDYEFDLAAGKVVPVETVQWYLERAEGEFVLPEDSDAFVAAGYVLSPDDCVRGIEREPVTALPYDELADERPFCVRSPDGKSIVVLRLIEAVPGEGPVTVVLSGYREDG
ncbi:serine/threonine-protein kinase [Streptomyces sp. LHD-70]|uniref:serine/threonine-protein kinase n=1 Tax=Streptomyces sp. LHD-70 TaxID=3072140 RepID=UPI00280D2E60|nr:serine/threonine-protein kinase [Streptomyces sp. LHD-70]MDQ8702213.1 serine/threonine-protein kinase [Streptomyces sp. LHD-70]